MKLSAETQTLIARWAAVAVSLVALAYTIISAAIKRKRDAVRDAEAAKTNTELERINAERAKEKEEREQQEKERTKDCEKITVALQMARYYEESLLPDLSLLSRIISAHEDIIALVKKVDVTKIRAFNTHEMNAIYSKEEIAQLDAFFVTCGATNPQIVHTYFALAKREIKPPSLQGLSDEEWIASEVWGLIYGFLNKLEYFSMAFQQRVADDDVVYQSLHQTYISIMKMLYYPIAAHNTESYDKTFVNAIGLFVEWHDRVQSRKEEEHKKNMELEPKPNPKV